MNFVIFKLLTYVIFFSGFFFVVVSGGVSAISASLSAFRFGFNRCLVGIHAMEFRTAEPFRYSLSMPLFYIGGNIKYLVSGKCRRPCGDAFIK